MERYLGRRVHPVPHRRIDEAIAHLPAPAAQGSAFGDLGEVAHAALVVVLCAGLAVGGAAFANLVEAALLAQAH